MSKLVALTVENYKRIELVQVQFEKTKGIFMVQGDNDAGKSSLIDAIAAAFGGKKWHDDMPIRRGAEFAKVVAETEDLIITAKWTEKSSRIVVENKKDRSRLRSSQEVLDSFYSSLALDPNAFTDMPDKERARMLRELVGVDVSKFDMERDKVYADRTLVNRDVATLTAQMTAIVVPLPVTDLGTEIDIAEVAEKKSQAVATNAANAAVRESVVAAKGELDRAEADLARLREAVLKQEAKVASFKTKCQQLETKQASLVDIDLTELDTIIANANAANKIVRAKKNQHLDHLRVLKQKQALATQIADRQAKSDELTDRIKAIDKAKADALAAAKFPVPGMTVDADAVYINGVPFSQISSSEQIRIGLAMSMASNPKLRAVLVRNGDMVQEKKLAIIASWAEENDVLVLMERRETDGAVGVVLEEGRIRSVPHDASVVVDELEQLVEPLNGAIVAEKGNIVILASEAPPSLDDEIERMMADMQ